MGNWIITNNSFNPPANDLAVPCIVAKRKEKKKPYNLSALLILSVFVVENN